MLRVTYTNLRRRAMGYLVLVETFPCSEPRGVPEKGGGGGEETVGGGFPEGGQGPGRSWRGGWGCQEAGGEQEGREE